jgi:hypothetical protein
MLSLNDFLNKYNEYIYEDYSSTIYYSCYNNNIEVLEWLYNDFVKEDFMYCEIIIQDLFRKGNFIVLEWLYIKYKDIFNNNQKIVNILEDNIIYKLKLLKYFFDNNFTNINFENIEEVNVFFSKFENTIFLNINDIIKKICEIGDIKMLKYMVENNYYNNYNFIMNYINNVNKFQKNIISDYITNIILNLDDLKIN